MNNRQLYLLAKKNYVKLILNYEYLSKGEINYRLKDLSKLREAILKFDSLIYLESNIDKLKEGPLFNASNDSIDLKTSEFSKISSFVNKLRTGLEFFILQFESNDLELDDTNLNIKLPQFKNFSDLSIVAKDFKKSLEIPLLDSKIDSDLNILSAEPGSIWLIIGVGSLLAVKLVGRIAWSAAVLKKKNSEAKIFEQHARTLELKNEHFESMVQAQKIQLNNLLEREANAISKEYYTADSPESIERLKLSITTISNLIDKGAQILPISTSDDVKQLFPEYEKLSLLESAIKKISEE